MAVSSLLIGISICVPRAWAQSISITSNTILESGDVGWEGWDVEVNGARLTVSGHHEFRSLVIRGNGVVTHPPMGTDSPSLDLTVVGDMVIEAGSSLDVSQAGFGPGDGPGAGGAGYLYGGGAGHGGSGGWNYYSGSSSGAAYGSLSNPATAGSGGGASNGFGAPGGRGGGLVRLQVGGSLTLDGSILANGGDGAASSQGGGGGGSGGSIWIAAATLSGSGTITANGGNGLGWDRRTGGGGGGRIAVETTVLSHTGTIQAIGGTGYVAGGAGTVFFKDRAKTLGDLVVANGGRNGNTTPFEFVADIGALRVDAGGLLHPLGVGHWTAESLVVANGGGVLIPGGAMVDVKGLARVGADGTITFLAKDTQPTENGNWVGAGSTLRAHGLQVDVGGLLTGTGQGYPSQSGPGAGPAGYLYGAGAGHGGIGGNSSYGGRGESYGSLTNLRHWVAGEASPALGEHLEELAGAPFGCWLKGPWCWTGESQRMAAMASRSAKAAAAAARAGAFGPLLES